MYTLSTPLHHLQEVIIPKLSSCKEVKYSLFNIFFSRSKQQYSNLGDLRLWPETQVLMHVLLCNKVGRSLDLAFPDLDTLMGKRKMDFLYTNCPRSRLQGVENRQVVHCMVDWEQRGLSSIKKEPLNTYVYHPLLKLKNKTCISK